MSLREEMRKYEQITGESAEHVPIIKLGAFLDGYEMGLTDVLDKIKTEIENDWQLNKFPSSPFSCGLRCAIEIIDKYKSENES